MLHGLIKWLETETEFHIWQALAEVSSGAMLRPNVIEPRILTGNLNIRLANIFPLGSLYAGEIEQFYPV